jgi:hypothetical protein
MGRKNKKLHYNSKKIKTQFNLLKNFNMYLIEKNIMNCLNIKYGLMIKLLKLENKLKILYKDIETNSYHPLVVKGIFLYDYNNKLIFSLPLILDENYFIQIKKNNCVFNMNDIPLNINISMLSDIIIDTFDSYCNFIDDIVVKG